MQISTTFLVQREFKDIAYRLIIQVSPALMQKTEGPQLPSVRNPCILSPSLCQKASPERLSSAFKWIENPSCTRYLANKNSCQEKRCSQVKRGSIFLPWWTKLRSGAKEIQLRRLSPSWCQPSSLHPINVTSTCTSG